MKFLTAGESHGKALVGILEGIPSGLSVKKEQIATELIRRKRGYGRGDRQKIETDEVEILSGIRFGKTLGSPICLMIQNKDWKNWEKIMSADVEDETDAFSVDVPRPGHADFVGQKKYNFKDMRNVLERSSARETTIRVALGAIGKIFLKECGVEIYSRVTRIGSVEDESTVHWSSSTLDKIDSSLVRMNMKSEDAILEINNAIQEGDTLGGEFEVCAIGVPVGLGSYVHWDRKLDGLIAQTFMSLNAIKGVDIGIGHKVSMLRGSECHDEIVLKGENVGYASNRAGGIFAGMSSGEPIVVRAFMKPISTLKKPLNSVHLKNKISTPAHYERSDVCAVPSAAVIGESLLALVLTQEVLKKFGGDSMEEILNRIKAWNE